MTATNSTAAMELQVYCDECEGAGRCLCAAVQECLQELGLEAQISISTSTIERVRAGIPLSPALCIDGQLVATGTDLSKESIGLMLLLQQRNKGDRRPSRPMMDD